MVTPSLKARFELDEGMREWVKQFGKAHLIASVFVGDLELPSSDHGQSSKRRTLESGAREGSEGKGDNIEYPVHNDTAKAMSTNSHHFVPITTGIGPSVSGPVDNGN